MELLSRQPDRRTTSVAWPADVDRRLNLLVPLAAGGERTSRAEILATLVTAAKTDYAALTEFLHTYRQLPDNALASDGHREDLPTVRSPGPRRSLT